MLQLPREARTTESRDQDDIMPHQFSLAQAVRKPAVTSKGGIVASQSRRAAEVGAQVLAAGGDCVDAIVATTFALNVLEPWNSGIGGGGAMVL
jgi:gamma-glutamyltranspeptidase/glutathione hydrolase